MDITAISKLGLLHKGQVSAIAVVENSDPAQWQAVQDLRQQGERVVAVSGEADLAELGCDRQLLLRNGSYQLVAC